jgi:hypothetical protein
LSIILSSGAIQKIPNEPFCDQRELHVSFDKHIHKRGHYLALKDSIPLRQLTHLNVSYTQINYYNIALKAIP